MDFGNFYHGTNQCFYLWQFITIFLDSQNLGYPYRRKNRWIFIFSATKWTWADGDESKGIPQWLGFTNLKPKPFVVVVPMR
jgi:hypothetical protein